MAQFETMDRMQSQQEQLGRYVHEERSVEADFRHGPGLGVRRTTLHEALRAAVAAEGIEVVPLAATQLARGADDVRVQTRTSSRQAGPQVRARFVLAADGLHSPVRRLLGLEASSRGPQRWGQRRHYGTRPWSAPRGRSGSRAALDPAARSRGHAARPPRRA